MLTKEEKKHLQSNEEYNQSLQQLSVLVVGLQNKLQIALEALEPIQKKIMLQYVALSLVREHDFSEQ